MVCAPGGEASANKGVGRVPSYKKEDETSP